MSNTDGNEEFSSLGELWQTLTEGVAPARPVVDIAARRRAQRLLLAMETGIAIAGCAVGAWLLGKGSMAIGVATLVYSVGGGAVGLVTRSMNLRVLGRSTKEYVEATGAILKARRNQDIAGVAVFLAAVAFFVFVRTQQVGSLDVTDGVISLALLLMANFHLRRAGSAQRELGAHNARSRQIPAD